MRISCNKTKVITFKGQPYKKQNSDPIRNKIVIDNKILEEELPLNIKVLDIR